MTLTEKAETQLQIIKQDIALCDRHIENSPPGSLVCHKNGSGFKWFCRSEDHTLTYISKTKQAYAAELAVKAYYVKKRQILVREAKAISSYLKKHDKHADALPFYELLPQGINELILEKPLNTSDLASELNTWQNSPFQTSQSHIEQKIIPVNDRLFVRSKSEALIASALLTGHIPFRYECEHILSGKSFYPDFTLRHPQSGKVFLWEHFGLIDNPSYRDNHLAKLRIYIDNGFIPTINLITTYETASNPLSLSLVNDLIEHYFI